MKARHSTIELCKLFTKASGNIISGEDAARALSLSRQGVWKTVRDLEKEGFSILAIPKKGYVLQGFPQYDLAPSFIGGLLPPICSWGKEILVFETVKSTQETAKKMGRQGKCDGIVVIAEEQTHGRGRRDRAWVSPKGTGLYFSIYFTPRLLPGRLQLVNLAAGLSVMEAVNNLIGVELSLKWPNDLLKGGKKVCGILSESSSDSELIRDCCTGIGINITLPEKYSKEAGLEKAASLSNPPNHMHRGCLAAAIIERFERHTHCLEKDGGKRLLALYRKECATLGKTVTVHTGNESIAGVAVEIGENGELLVNQDGRIHSFCAADVVHASPNKDFP